MTGYGWVHTKHCRWCGLGYRAIRPRGRDGFCCPACKQAHYRAYKKYVTASTAGHKAAAGRYRKQK